MSQTISEQQQQKCQNELCTRAATWKNFCTACYHKAWLRRKGQGCKRADASYLATVQRLKDAYNAAVTVEARLRLKRIIQETEIRKAAN